MPDFTHMNSAEDDDRYNSVHALNGGGKALSRGEVVFEGSRDRTVDREESGGTSSIQCKSVVKSVPVRQRDDATCEAESD